MESASSTTTIFMTHSVYTPSATDYFPPTTWPASASSLQRLRRGAGETPALLLQWCISLLQVVENLLGVYLCLYFLRSEDFSYCAVFVDEICGAEGAHVFLSAHRLLSPCSELLEGRDRGQVRVPPSQFFFKTFEIIFLTIPAGQ